MNTIQFAPQAASMSQIETDAPSVPIGSADPAGDSFALMVQEILHQHGYTPDTEAGDVAAAIIDAYASRIAHERQRSDRAAAELRILVDRDQAKDLILAQMRVTAGQTMMSNARAAAHITHLTGQVEAVRRLAQQRAGEPEQVDRDLLDHIVSERQFRGIPDAPMIGGFAASSAYSMGRFRREYSELPMHLRFVGWALVLGSTHHLPQTSLLEAAFQLEGRPVPASILATAHGLALEQLLP